MLMLIFRKSWYFIGWGKYTQVQTFKMASRSISALTVKADSHIACRSHAAPMPCRAAKGLECVFPIWFTQCGRVWFTLAMPRPCHALTMPFFSRPRHSAAVETACGAASVRLPATTRSSIVIRSVPISDASGQYETQHSSWTRKSLLF